ncbi:MAG: ribosome hibernation-promoting factor, HPF/YfiA family [Geodermatophilaceae bacterium]
MDILVRGRNVEVPDHYRQHVAEKLSRVERYDHKLISVDVELTHEKNRRQSDACQRVEITCTSRGPVVRSEACAADFYSALDHAVAKLEARLRRVADRRRVHHGRHTPTSVHAATGDTVTALLEDFPAETDRDSDAHGQPSDGHRPGQIVREKEHPSEPMTIDQALLEMELVGHDFFLFRCKDTDRASVVYRRTGYDYGVIRLAP